MGTGTHTGKVPVGGAAMNCRSRVGPELLQPPSSVTAVNPTTARAQGNTRVTIELVFCTLPDSARTPPVLVRGDRRHECPRQSNVRP